jgi:hypothetical protein
MPLLLDERNLLPLGIHEASLDTVEAYFGQFQRSDRRLKLFRQLSNYLTEVKKAECGSSAIIDGSFVMSCVDEPEDIDLILVLPDRWDSTLDLKPYQYDLVSKKQVRKTYGNEIFVVRSGSVDESKWIAFFHQVNIKWCRVFDWPLNSTKGLVRVTL